MNKKDIEKERRIREQEDEEILLNAIHQNYRENHNKLIMKNNIAKIKKEKQERKEKIKKRIVIALVSVLAVVALFLMNKYAEYAEEQCMNMGHSEYFCEKNL